jgi:hypothetical protein
MGGTISCDYLADKCKSVDEPGLCSNEGQVLVTSIELADAVAMGNTSLQTLALPSLYVGSCWMLLAADGEGGQGRRAKFWYSLSRRRKTLSKIAYS